MHANKELLYQIGLALRPFARLAKRMRQERRRQLLREDKLLLSDLERAEVVLRRLDEMLLQNTPPSPIEARSCVLTGHMVSGANIGK